MNMCSECGGISQCLPGCGGPPLPKRINVAVNPETVAALQAVIEREGVTLTEAVRRLLGYGEVVWRATKEDHAAVLLQWPDETKEVVIL